MAGEMVPLREHLAALHAAHVTWMEERDRRYAEVAVEREKALKIKEVADLTALDLAREIQKYKDEKANELRSQIERERGNYATRSDLTALGDKFDAALKPVSEFVTASRGQSSTDKDRWGYLVGVIGVLATLIAIYQMTGR